MILYVIIPKIKQGEFHMQPSSNGQMLGLFKIIGDAVSYVLNSIFGKIVKAILSPIINSIMTLYYFICKTIYSAFLLPIARVIDILQLIFRKFAGIDAMRIKNLNRSAIFGNTFQSEDIVANLISSDIVMRIFFAMLILAVILLIVTTFIANIKSEFNAQDKGGNSKKKVFKNAFRGLLNFVAVPVISLFAIFLSNGLLRAIDGATQINGSQTYISGQLFVASAYNANRARRSQDNEKGNGYYQAKSFGAIITGDYSTGVQDGNGYANFGIFLDDAGTYGYRAADKIDNAFATGLNVKVESSIKPNMLYYGGLLDFWYGGMDIVVSTISMGATQGGTQPGGFTTFPEGYKMSVGAFLDMRGTLDILSMLGISTSDTAELGLGIYYELDYSTNKGVGADYGHISFSIYDTALVFYYYDLGLTTFSYLTYIIAGTYFCYALLVTAVGLIKRLFMVTTLFIISPPVCALYPIDEGKALERWRKAFVLEVTSAYAVIVVMNIFLSLLPLFTSIEVFSIYSVSSRVLQLFPLYTWWLDPFSFDSGSWSKIASEGAAIGTTALTGGALGALLVVIGFLNAFARLLIIIGGLHFFRKATKQIAEVLGVGNAMEEGAEVAAKIGKTVAGAATLAVGAMTAGAGAAAIKGAGAVGKAGKKGAGDLGEGGKSNNPIDPNPVNSMTGAGENPSGAPNPNMGLASSGTINPIKPDIGPIESPEGPVWARVEKRKAGGSMATPPIAPPPPIESSSDSTSTSTSGSSGTSSGDTSIPSTPIESPSDSTSTSMSGSSGTSSGDTSIPETPPVAITNRKGKATIITQRNAWQRFTKFANITKMFYNVATGKSGATDTAAAMEKNFDNPKLKPYKDRATEKRKELEDKLEGIMDQRKKLVQKNRIIANQISSLPAGSPKIEKLIE